MRASGEPLAGEPSLKVGMPGIPSVPVMTPAERRTFWVLGALAGGAIGGFAYYWLSLAPRGASLLAGYVVASLLIAFQSSSWLARWALLLRMERPNPATPDPRLRVAAVTTFVPDAEPLAMLERTLAAMVAMDFPHDTWVLDEGDDARVKELCARLGVRHFTRRGSADFERESGPFAAGTKYGNYNAWLGAEGARRYDVLAAFDPDHVPEREYLNELLGQLADPRVAFVQSPQAYYNQRASMVARGAAEESYTYYSTHLMASFALGQAILIGSHSVQRISALEKIGGFAMHDADDLLTSLRYRAEGMRGVYVPRILALGLTPADWRGYVQQQLRWTQSVVDLKLSHLPRVSARLSFVPRALALLHGAFYLRGLAIPVGYLALAALLLMGAAPAYLGMGPLAALLALAATFMACDRFRRRFFLDPASEGGVHWRSAVLQCAKWPVQALALVRALRRRSAPYAVTPKRSVGGAPLLAGVHCTVALAMLASAAIGRTLGAGLVLQGLGFAVSLLSAGIAVSALSGAREPFVPALHDERRMALFGVRKSAPLA